MLCQQLVVGARFHDALGTEDEDAVIVLDGGQAVGDGQRGAAMGQLFEAPAHQDLALVVKGAGGLVQDQNRRVLQEDAGDGDALLLAAGKLDAALADIGVEAVLQSEDEPLGTGQAGRFDDLFAGGTGLAVGDVIRHRAAEQIHVLLDDADVLAQALQGDMLDVLPVDVDVAAGHIIEAGNEVAQRRLAAAGGADQSQPLAGLDVKADMMQNLVVVVRVFEADILEPDGTGAGLERLCVGCVVDGDGRVHDLGKALDAGHAALELLGELDDAADGGNEGGDIEHISHEVARADLAIHQRQATRQDDHKVHQAVEQAGGGVERGHGVVAQGLDLLKVLVALRKFLAFLVLSGKGFDDTLTQQAVLDGGIQLADLDALLAEPGAELGVQLDGDDAHQRHAGEDCQRQRHTGPAEDEEGRQNLDEGDEKFLRAVVGELGHVEQVVGDAAHDGADLGVVIIGVVEQQQVVKGVAAHVRLDVDAHDMADAGHEILGRAVDDAEHEIEPGQLEHDAGRQRDAHTHGRVGDGAHDLGQDDVAQGGQRRAEQVKEEHALILCQIRQKAPDERAAAGVVCAGVLDGFGLIFWHDASYYFLL